MGSASQDYLHVLTELEHNKSATTAATQRANSQIWGNAVAKLGDFAGDAVKQLAIDKKARKIEQEDAFITKAFNVANQEWQDQQKAAQMGSMTGAPNAPQAAPYQQGNLAGNTRVTMPDLGVVGPRPQFHGLAEPVRMPGENPPPAVGPQQPAKPLRSSPFPTPSELMAGVRPERAIPIINGLAAIHQPPTEDPEKRLKRRQSIAEMLNAFPENERAQAWPMIVQISEGQGLAAKGELPPVYNPQEWKAISGTLAKPSTGAQPTEASLAADLSSPDPVVRDRAKTALDRLKPATSPAGRLVPMPGPNGPVYGTPTEGAPVYEKPSGEGAGLWVLRNGKITRVREADVLPTDQRPPADQQISPTAAMEQGNAKEVAKGLKDGTTSPEVLLSSRTTQQGMALLSELHKLGVDTDKMTREWLGTKAAIRSLDNTSQLRLAQVINKASASLDRVEQLNKQWNDVGARVGIKVLNHASLKAAQNGAYGPEAASVAQRLEGQIADVTGELGQGIMGGNAPTDHALILASKNLSTDWTQKVLSDSIEQARYNLKLAQSARNEMLNQLGVQSTQFQVPPPANATPPAVPKVNPFR